MSNTILLGLVVGLTGSLLSCTDSVASSGSPQAAAANRRTDEFSAYWHQGAAEISSYTLEQARYGEVHPGHAVLIFVTEDFSRSKQVKLDDPVAAGADRLPVLKLNLTKKFNTGVYPYSMMSSIFTPTLPAEDSRTVKVTTSVQEWCGHTFEQFNRTEGGYRVQLRSYFETEGDRERQLSDVVLEDGVWNLIRLDPSMLPKGTLQMVPGSMFQRLRHTDLPSHQVVAKLAADPEDERLLRYTLEYAALDRTLSIRFAKRFPHEIESWEESNASGFGAGATRLTTRATLKKRRMLDYWRRNSLADRELRAELGLD